MARFCDCGCGASLAGLRSDAVYASEACSKRARRSASPDKDRTEHGLDEARALHEEHKSRWTTIVREHLNRTLVVTGYVSAEDFDALGIPPEHSNLANAQMGSYSKLGYMEKVSWRRSTKPSRKSGTIWTHRITEKGRRELSKLAGVDAGSDLGSQTQATNTQGGDPAGTGAGHRAGEVESSVDSGENGGGAGTPRPSDNAVNSPDQSEPLQLDLAKSPSMFDPDQRAA